MLTRGTYKVASLTRSWAALFSERPKKSVEFLKHKRELEYLANHPDKRLELYEMRKLRNSMNRKLGKTTEKTLDKAEKQAPKEVRKYVAAFKAGAKLRSRLAKNRWWTIFATGCFIFLLGFGRSQGNQRKQASTTTRSLDYPNISSIEVACTNGANLKTYVATVHYKNKQSMRFQVANPNVFLENLEAAQKQLHPNDKLVPVTYTPDNRVSLWKLASTSVHIAFSVLIIGWMLQTRKGFNINTLFGKTSVRKIHSDKDVKIRFKDVAGMEQAKLEITEFVDFLKNNAKFKEMGAKIPRGALLTGPPGTGKTMLAKACAGESGVPFYYMSGSEFVEMFVGVGAARVRELFMEAKAEAPSIIFIDEIDTIGKKRSGSSNEEKDATLNQLLVEMDGFKTDQNVIVLAATNRRDVLDSALTRPGRFDRLIEVELPDISGRIEIFEVHLKPLKLDPKRTPEQYAKRLATLTPGFSGADIANLCNEAAILAARRSSKFVEAKDFENATERVLAGLQKKNLMTPQNKKTVAYHEAGHAVTAWFLEGGDPLVKVTIIPRSKGSLGYAQYLPREAALKTKEELMDRVAIILGGRMAEEHFFGKVTTGAADDLQKVYELTRAMVTQFGMSEAIGNVGFEQEGYINKYSEHTGAKIDEEIKKIVQEGEERCRALIREKRDLIEKLALMLMEKESLTTQDIASVLGERPYQTDDYRKYLEMASS